MGTGTKQNITPSLPKTWQEKGYTIMIYNGFQPFGDRMGLVASYVISKEGFACGAAFAVNGLELAAASTVEPYSSERFDTPARAAINLLIQSDMLVDREEYTFEYSFDEKMFVQVKDPSWWKKSNN